MEDKIDEKTLQERKIYLDNLKGFISEHQNRISGLLQELSWTPEHFVKRQETVVCPHSSGHVLPANSLKKHTEVCQFTSKGCPKEEVHLQLLQGPSHTDNDLLSPIKLDENLINRIVWSNEKGQRRVPVSHEEFMVNFDPPERLKIQEFVSQQLQSANEVLNVEKDEFLSIDWQIVAKKGGLSKDKPKTKYEILNELRDLRRRRQTYRAKNVHITKKSYTEIIREVINNQINILAGGPGEYQHTPKTEENDQKMRNTSERRDSDQETREVGREGRSTDRDQRQEKYLKRRYNQSDDEDSRRHRDREERRKDRSTPKHKRHRSPYDRSRSRGKHKHRSRSSSKSRQRSEQNERDQTTGQTAEGTSEDIPDSELFDVTTETESRVSSTGMEMETDRESLRSSKHKHKHKHKQKHRHKHKHRRDRDSDFSD